MTAGVSGISPRPRGGAADLYRIMAVLLVVLGHWLVSAVTYRDGRFGNDYPLAVLPWTQWLTLVFQVVPVFFAVGGYASAATWGRQPGREWVRRRVAAVLGPTAAYLAVTLMLFTGLSFAGIDGRALAFGGWAVAMHLWFLPVYVTVLLLTPAAIAADRRWGARVPAVLTALAVLVDVGSALWPPLAAANYLLCWAVGYQIGICWRRGRITGRSATAMVVGGGVVVAVLLAARWYPVSMVGAPGAAAQNNFPPTAALVAFVIAQSGVLLLLAPAAERAAAGRRATRIVATVTPTVLGLYLWQMIPVVVVALAAYPTGLMPQAEPGTARWYVLRLVWVAALAVVMGAVLLIVWVLRAVLARPVPALGPALPRWAATALLVTGAASAIAALVEFALHGVFPGGRFPGATSIAFVAGVGALALAGPRSTDASPPADM